MTGSMMQNAAVLWHVSSLAGDSAAEKAKACAMVGLVKFVAIISFSLVGGVIADALDRRKLMIVTQTAMTIFAAALAWFTFGRMQSPWPIYVLTALSSAAGVIDGPARHALIPSLVPRNELANAITLNTIVFHFAFVSGPAIAGVMMGSMSIGWVYLANAATFLAVIAALMAMRDIPAPKSNERSDVSLRASIEGLRFVFGSELIRSSMLVDFFATFFASAKALLPIYCQVILHVHEKEYGRLYSAEAFGSLIAAGILARYQHAIRRRGAWLLWAVAGYGLATIGFGVSTTYWWIFVFLALGGVADAISIVFRNVIRQHETPDHMRGRMTSVNMLFFMGGPQLGEAEAGGVAQLFGAPFSVISGGVGCLVSTAWIALKSPKLRRYEREDATTQT